MDTSDIWPDNGEIPLGFGMALAQDNAAIDRFTMLSEEERDTVLRRARNVNSREEMQSLIASFRDAAH